MKTPKFLTKLAARLTPKPRKRYQATARAARASQVDEYDDDQPTTKLSSAFVVVLILHVVAVGGIYAFNSIKASRRTMESAQTAPAAGVVETPKSGSEGDSAPAAPAVPATNLTAAHTPAAHPTDAAAASAAGSPAGTKPGVKQYQVKAGDNASKIAFAYRITPSELLAANNLKDNAVLHIGQTLTIPDSKSAAKPQAADAQKPGTPASVKDIPNTKTTPGLYSVKKGDTAHSIAKTFGIPVEELLKVNKIADPKKLQLGQLLKLPPRKS